MPFMRALYWVSVAVPFVGYAGYPAVVTLLSRHRRARVDAVGPLPTVTVCVAAHNEERTIHRCVESLLAQEYAGPPPKVMVGLDGCTDGTRDIVRRLADQFADRVSYLDLPRRGKASTDNALVAAVDTELVATTAAGAEWLPGTLAALAGPFRDPTVGCTTGRFVPRSDGSGAAEGEALYWRLEQRVMEAESALGILAMASGTCMCHRRSIFRPIPEDSDGDVAIAPNAALQGYRVVFVPDARVIDDPPDRMDIVLRNRRRMALRAVPATMRFISGLVARGRFGPAAALIAHKLFRWLTPFALAGWAVAAIALAAERAYRELSLIGAASAATLSVVAVVGGPRVRGTIVSFAVAQLAFALACLDALRGRRARMWTRD